jgi:hypothetical protein
MTGAACAARVRIRPGHNATWEIAPNLWGGVVGPPGSKKTPATSEIFKALSRLEVEAGADHENAVANHKAARAEHDAESKALHSAVNSLRKRRLEGKSKPEDAEKEDSLKRQLENLLKNEPQPPSLRWFRINDPTIEALQDILKQDPNCILFERDELTGMLAQWQMDGHQMDRTFYLESWNGTNPYKGRRVIRGDFRIPLLCLSLFGVIQHVKLTQYLRNPQTNLTHDGAMQRFQILVYPDPPPKRKHTDQYENTEAKNRFYEILKKLAYADFRDYGGLTDEFNKTPWFHFDVPAKEFFEDWQGRQRGKNREQEGGPRPARTPRQVPEVVLRLKPHLSPHRTRGHRKARDIHPTPRRKDGRRVVRLSRISRKAHLLAGQKPLPLLGRGACRQNHQPFHKDRARKWIHRS